jgi:AsmA protein
LKWVVIGAGGLLALLVIAALILTQLVDPNRYRGPIERQVTAVTGRAFRLQGDIDLTFFPWLSLTTGPAALSSPRVWPYRPFTG